MVNDLIDLIVRINLALAAGIAVVLAVRALARRGFGARVAYSLWILPVLAAGACFLPPRIERLTIVEPLAPVSSFAPVVHTGAWQVPPAAWLALWAAGFTLSLGVLVLRQGRFSRALGRLRPRADLGAKVFGAESNAHGPAVIGVLRPIIVTPADFDEQFSDEERRIVLAHERAHLEQGDPLINALVVALQCANWFNPLVHLGARALKLDQELAADAAVLATSARRQLAEAILKTQIAAAAPLGAAWPPNSVHSLKERIAMLKHTLPSRTQRLLGVSAIAVLTLGVCAAAWAAQPARVVVSKAPHIARADAAPFIEPPVADASQLASAPQTQEEWRLADVNAGRDDAKAVNADDENADESDQGDAANLDDANASEDDAGDAVLSDEDRQEIANARLSPQERERIRAEVRAAAAESRVAAAQARAAVHAVQAQAVREAMVEARAAGAEARAAARAAQGEAVREAVAAAREVNSPQVQAEIRAMAARASHLAHDATLTNEQREQIRSDIRARAEHLREMTHHSCRDAHHDQD